MNEVLVTEYFELIIMLGHIGIIWWSTTTVLCMSIIKLTLDFRMESRYAEYSSGLCVLIGLFFMSVIGYGFFSAYYVSRIKTSVLSLITLDLVIRGNIASIMSCELYGYLIGTTTFIFLFMGWVWVLILKIGKD